MKTQEEIKKMYKLWSVLPIFCMMFMFFLFTLSLPKISTIVFGVGILMGIFVGKKIMLIEICGNKKEGLL